MRRAWMAALVALALGAGTWLGAATSGSHAKPTRAKLQPAAAVSAVTTLPLPPPQAPVVITNPDGSTTVIDSGPGRIAVQSSGPNGQSQYQGQFGPGAQKQVQPGQSQWQRQSGNGSQSQSQSQSR